MKLFFQKSFSPTDRSLIIKNKQQQTYTMHLLSRLDISTDFPQIKKKNTYQGT